MNTPITIVTAYFDIGRGEWTSNKGYREKLARSADAYIKYFEYLASLDNEMVIFTSSDLKSKIESIRKGKPTTVIAVDIKNKFKYVRKRIERIQKDVAFISQLAQHQLQNPEYWSPDYVLVCNLKTYFVTKAINCGLIKTPMVAWVDFGYCRKPKVINGLKLWDYPFNPHKIHFFTIKKGLNIKSEQQAFQYMIDNKVYIIGGAVVGSKEKWLEMAALVFECQRKTLQYNIVDDDQGIFLMCFYKRPDLIKLNYLGRGKWFDLFRCYRRSKWGSRLHALRRLILRK